jgi:1-acyl-sn-glycerol-3-phosphate acyltransferase
MEANFSSIIYRGTIFWSRFLFKLLRGKTFGLENVPEHGAFLMACNHCSHLDPPLVACQCPRHPVFSVARHTLLTPRMCKKLNMILVNRDKVGDLSAIKTVLGILRAGYPVMIFPEGTRSPDGHLMPPKKGVGFIVSRARVPVVPVRIFGTYEVLPKGRRWPSFKHAVRIVFGKAFYPECTSASHHSDGSEVNEIVSREIMRAIAELHLPE